jgi:hypothetical protein
MVPEQCTVQIGHEEAPGISVARAIHVRNKITCIDPAVPGAATLSSSCASRRAKTRREMWSKQARRCYIEAVRTPTAHLAIRGHTALAAGTKIGPQS